MRVLFRSPFLGLCCGEQPVVLDGVVDGRGGQQGIEAAPASGGIVPGQDGLDYGALGQRLTGLDRVFAVRFEVVHVETPDVIVIDGVGGGVFGSGGGGGGEGGGRGG